MIDNPDISTIIKCLDLDMLNKARYFRKDDLIFTRVGNTDEHPLYVALADDPNEGDIFIFDDVSSVAVGDLTELITYIVPPAKVFNLDQIEVSGDNIAKYTVYINGDKNKIKRTWHGSSLNDTIKYNSFMLSAGDEIKVDVIHYNDLDMSGDFNATIEGKLKDA